MFSNMSNELSKDFFILLLLIFPLLFLVQGIMDVAIWAVTRDGCNRHKRNVFILVRAGARLMNL